LTARRPARVDRPAPLAGEKPRAAAWCALKVNRRLNVQAQPPDSADGRA